MCFFHLMNILVKIMKKILLSKDTPIYCLVPSEAIMLDDHIDGYFSNGIKINEGDVSLTFCVWIFASFWAFSDSCMA